MSKSNKSSKSSKSPKDRKDSMTLSGSLGDAVRMKKAEKFKYEDDDEDEDVDEDEEEDEEVVEKQSEENDSVITPETVSKGDSQRSEEDMTSDSAEETSKKEQPGTEISPSVEGPKKTYTTPKAKVSGTPSVPEKLTPIKKSNDTNEGFVVKYFVTQLQQVNNIVEGLLDELQKNEQKGRYKKDNDGNKNHQHGNIDKTPPPRSICCITLKDKSPKPSDNCLVCQLISLQDRIDTLINKKLIFGEKEDVLELRKQQKKLKDQLHRLIQKCDPDEITEAKSLSKTKGKEKRASICTDDDNTCKGDYDDRSTKSYKGKAEISDGKSKAIAHGKVARPPQGIFFNCINELLVLIKSMNCISSPGTFWQRAIKPPQPIKRRRSKCYCDRQYPHMHGELNGVAVILKLYPSKKNQKEPEPEPVVEEEQVEEEELVEEEEPEVEPEVVDEEEPFDPSKYLLEDDLSTLSSDSEEEEEEEEDDDEEFGERESADYALSDFQTKPAESEPKPTVIETSQSGSKDRSITVEQPLSQQSIQEEVFEERTRKDSIGSGSGGSKVTTATKGSKGSKKSSKLSSDEVKTQKVDPEFEDDEEITSTTAQPQKKSKSGDAASLKQNGESTLTLLLGGQITPFTSSVDTKIKDNKQKNHESTNPFRLRRKKQDNLNIYNNQRSSPTDNNPSVNVSNSDKSIYESESTVKTKNSRTIINDCQKRNFTIPGNLNTEMCDEYCIDDKKIIIKGLTAEDILDSYFKNNNNLLFHIKPVTNDINIEVPEHETKSFASDCRSTANIFDSNIDYAEDEEEVNKRQSLNESQLDYFSYRRNTTYDKSEDNFVSLSTTFKKSSTTISNYESVSSTDSGYSFNALLDSVLKSSKSNIFNANNSNDKCSTNKSNKSNTNDKDLINEKLKNRKSVYKEEIATKSSHSSCSIKLKLVRRGKSKIKIGMNSSRNSVKNEVNNEELQAEKHKRNKQKIKKQNKLQKENHTKKCGLQPSDSLVESNDCKDQVICQLQKELISESDNDQTGDDKNDENKPNCTTKDSNEIPWNWKITKPDIRKLEIFLNMVNETQQFLLAKCKSEKGSDNNDNNCDYEYLSDYENSERDNNSPTQADDETSSDSSDSYESCDDTCNADFMDALSTCSCCSFNQIITKTELLKQNPIEKESNLTKLLKTEITKCNKMLNAYIENDTFSKLYSKSKRFFNNDFIIKVMPDDSNLKNSNNRFENNTSNKEICTEKSIDVKFCPLEMAIIKYLQSQQYGFDNFLFDDKSNKSIPARVNKEDIICANFDVIGDNIENLKKGPFSVHETKFTRSKNNNETNFGNIRTKIPRVYPTYNKSQRKLNEKEKHLKTISDITKNNHEDDNGTDDASKCNEADNLKEKSEKQFTDEKLKVVRENDIKNEKPKDDSKDKTRINSLIYNTSDSNESNKLSKKTKYKHFSDFPNNRSKTSINFKNIKEVKQASTVYNIRQKRNLNNPTCNNSSKLKTRSFDPAEELEIGVTDSYSVSTQSSECFLSDDSCNADLVKDRIFSDESILEEIIDLSPEKLHKDEVGDISLNSNTNQHKGILKKKSLKLNDCTNNDELSSNHLMKLDLQNSKDENESKISRKNGQRKSVKFTMPSEYKEKILADILQKRNRNITKKITMKHVNMKDNNSKCNVQKQINSNENDEIKQTVLSSLYQAQLNLLPMSLRFAEFISNQKQALQKYSRTPSFHHKQLLTNKLHTARPMEYIDVPATYNMVSHIKLKPVQRSHSNAKIDEINRLTVIQHKVQKGFIKKMAVYNILQYFTPVCMNVKNSTINIKFRNILLAETKGKKKGFLQQINDFKEIELNNTIYSSPAKGIKSPRSSNNDSLTANLPCLENKNIHQADEFLEYFNDIREDSLLKVNDKSSEEDFSANGSKLLFDVTARPDAILSITAKGGRAKNQKHESIPSLQNIKNNLIKSKNHIKIRQSSAGTGKQTKGFNNEFSNNNVPDRMINSDSSGVNKKYRLEDHPMFQKEATINIKLTNVLRNESNFRGKKKIKVIGRIIEPKSGFHKMKNIFFSENLPLYHRIIEDDCETVSSDTYSVISKTNYPIHKIKSIKIKDNNVPSRIKLRSPQNQITPKNIKNEYKVEKRISNERRSTLLPKNNFTRPYPFNFDKRKEIQSVDKNNKTTITSNFKPQFYTRVSKNNLNQWKRNAEFQNSSLPNPKNKNKINRPRSCGEKKTKIDDLTTQNIMPKNNADTRNYGTNIQNLRTYSKSLDAINLQHKEEINQVKLNKIILNNDIYSTKNSIMKTVMDGKKMKDQLEIEANVHEAQKNYIAKRQFILPNHKRTLKGQTCVANNKKFSTNSKPSNSSILRSQTSLIKVPSKANIAKESSTNVCLMSEKDYEFVSLNNAEIICPIREHKIDESNSDRSVNSKLSKLKKEIEYVTEMKSKINTTFPETAVVRKNLLDKVCKSQSSSKINAIFQNNDVNKFDCYGAPLKDDLDISFYNEYGKPQVNIYGCKLYDKSGIPKRGAYGKPIHYALRKKLSSALKNAPITNRQSIRNENFEEDLLSVLSKYNGLKTDLYGRVYDGYGRPLFDQYGYLQYDLTGNPLTDAYNRSLHDQNRRPLITQTICNSTNFKTRPPLKNVGNLKLPQNDKISQKSSLTKLSSEHICQSPSLTSLHETEIKNEILFDECSVSRDQNKELSIEKSNSKCSLGGKIDESIGREGNYSR